MIADTRFHGTLRRRGLASPAAAFVVSLLCLAGQLLVVAHQSVERHVRCAEHGEMSHLGSAAVELPARPEHPDSAIDSPVASRESGHDHCTFLGCSNRQQTKPILVVGIAPEPSPRPAPGPVPIVAPQTDRILLSAPKIAPPAC